MASESIGSSFKSSGHSEYVPSFFIHILTYAKVKKSFFIINEVSLCLFRDYLDRRIRLSKQRKSFATRKKEAKL